MTRALTIINGSFGVVAPYLILPVALVLIANLLVIGGVV